MKQKKIAGFLALVLAAVMLLSACSGMGMSDGLAEALRIIHGEGVPFSEMEYVRPDMNEFQKTLDQACESARNSRDIDQVEEDVLDFYDVYDNFSTMENLSNIYYCKDLRDTYWQSEYEFCTEQTSTVEAGLDTLFRTLAKSPILDVLEGEDYFGEGFFDDYQGQSIWDETYTDLMNREAQLVGRYYELSGEGMELEPYSDEYFRTTGAELAELFVQLVAVRQEIADYLGYDDYLEYAYEAGYARDFSPAEVAEYTRQVREKLVPLYRKINQAPADSAPESVSFSQKETFAYVQKAADAMGGEIGECFDRMSRLELYDITPGDYKFNGSFEVYLSAYAEPYVFVNPTGTAYDPLTFAHEFGHFCNEYLSGGSYVSVDVSEIFSQGMEYLSLCYGEPDEAVQKLKLTDCLSTYVEQTAYNEFEQQVYALRGDALNTEAVFRIYEQIGTDYGFTDWDWDSRDFVTISHFFTSPMYIISYVVSNDAAFQYYQLEKEEAGSGLEIFARHLDTEQPYFLAFLEEAELESPFAPGRVDSVAELLKQELE